MKKTYSFILLFLATVAGIAQTSNLKGKVTDQQTQSVIPFASVAIHKSGSDIPLDGTTTTNEGLFEIKKVKSGTYDIVFSFIGYEKKVINNVSVNGDKITDIGVVKMKTSSVNLDAIEVKAMKKASSAKIDRKSYSVSDFETAKGGTAVDVLNKLPSVSVSPDGAVSVRGTDDFIVYLNGKPTQMDPSMLLAQISGNSIDNIDIITVPSARYDAQGKGGIINISTKKSAGEGLSVSANMLAGGGPWNNLTDKYSDYKLNDDRYGGGLNIFYVKNNLTLYGSANFNERNVNGMRTGDARLLQKDGSYYHMVASGERPEWYKYHSINGGIDYKINDKSDISASYFYANRNEGRSAYYVYRNLYGDINKKPVTGIDPAESYIYNPNTDNRYGKFHTANVDYKLKLDNSDELSISAFYEHSELDRNLDNLDYAFDNGRKTVNELKRHFNQTDDTPLDVYRLSVDYSKKLDNGHSLNFGFQPQFYSIGGSNSYDTLDVATKKWGDNEIFDNSIDMDRSIIAGYFDYSGSIGKLNFMAGLRLEYTDQELKIENPKYFNIFNRDPKSKYTVNQLDWFPTLHIDYNITKSDKINFAASRRISRPPVKNMAPFLYRRHYEVYVVGDPSLEPEYLTKAEISYDKKIGHQSFNITGFYRGTDNAIFRVNTVYDKENVLIRSYTNSGNTQSLGAELNANLSLASFLKLYLGGSLFNYKVEGDIFGYKENSSSTNWSLKGNANFIITDEIKFTADFNLKSATVTAQGKNELFYMTNAALSYSPKQLKGWDFSLRALDILNSNTKGLNTRAYDSSGKQIFFQETEYIRQGTIIEIGAAYKFNINKSKKAKKDAFGSKEF